MVNDRAEEKALGECGGWDDNKKGGRREEPKLRGRQSAIGGDRILGSICASAQEDA